MRHTGQALSPTSDFTGMLLREFISTYDGVSSRMMSSGESGKSGAILDEPRNTSMTENSLRPLLYFVRPFAAEHGLLERESLQVIQPAPDSGLVSVHANGGRQFVVDPDRDFIILSYSQTSEATGSVLQQAELEYREHSRLGWVPTAWTLTLYSQRDSRKPAQLTSATVTKITAGDRLDASRFRINFPSSTHVYDVPLPVILSQIGR